MERLADLSKNLEEVSFEGFMLGKTEAEFDKLHLKLLRERVLGKATLLKGYDSKLKLDASLGKTKIKTLKAYTRALVALISLECLEKKRIRDLLFNRLENVFAEFQLHKGRVRDLNESVEDSFKRARQFVSQITSPQNGVHLPMTEVHKFAWET